MTVDAQLDELAALLTRAGVSPFAVPRDVAVLEEIERAVAPLRLPAPTRRLWERVDAWSYGVVTYPALTTPEFALEAWQRDQDAELVPARLFPICYTSWAFVFIELHAPEVDDGGTLFEWMYGGADFEVAYDDLEDWLSVQIAAIKAGEAEPRRRPTPPPYPSRPAADQRRTRPTREAWLAPAVRHDHGYPGAGLARTLAISPAHVQPRVLSIAFACQRRSVHDSPECCNARNPAVTSMIA